MRAIKIVLILVVGSLIFVPGAAAQQVDTVRVGSPSLNSARLMAGRYTVDSFRRVDGQDAPNSTTEQTISRGSLEGADVFNISMMHASADGDTTVSLVTVRASDLSLLHHRVKGRNDSTAVAVNADFLTGWVVLPDQPIQLIDQRLSRPVFPVAGQVPWMFPLLPLEVGYAAAIPHYSQWDESERWSTIRVLTSERVAVDGVDYDCWKIDGGELFPGYNATYWVDKNSRRIVQGVARGSGAGPEYWSVMRAH